MFNFFCDSKTEAIIRQIDDRCDAVDRRIAEKQAYSDELDRRISESEAKVAEMKATVSRLKKAVKRNSN